MLQPRRHCLPAGFQMSVNCHFSSVKRGFCCSLLPIDGLLGSSVPMKPLYCTVICSKDTQIEILARLLKTSLCDENKHTKTDKLFHKQLYYLISSPMFQACDSRPSFQWNLLEKVFVYALPTSSHYLCHWSYLTIRTPYICTERQ